MAQMDWGAFDAKTKAMLEARLKAAIEKVAYATHESIMHMGAPGSVPPRPFTSAWSGARPAPGSTWQEVKPAEKPAPSARSGVIPSDFGGELYCTNALGQRVPVLTPLGDRVYLATDQLVARALSTLAAMDKLP